LFFRSKAAFGSFRWKFRPVVSKMLERVSQQEEQELVSALAAAQPEFEEEVPSNSSEGVAQLRVFRRPVVIAAAFVGVLACACLAVGMSSSVPKEGVGHGIVQLEDKKQIFDDVAKAVERKGPEMMKMVKGVIQFVIIDGGSHGKFLLDLKHGSGQGTYGEDPHADITITMSNNNFAKFAYGQLYYRTALSEGKMEVEGNMRLLERVPEILNFALSLEFP